MSRGLDSARREATPQEFELSHYRLTAIATTDADFTRIPKVALYTCNEKILSQHRG